MDKKIIGILVLILFSLNFISALSFDNVVSDVEISKSTNLYYGNKLVEYKPIWETYAPIKIDNAFELVIRLCSFRGITWIPREVRRSTSLSVSAASRTLFRRMLR